MALLHQRHSALSGKAQIELAKTMCDNKQLLKRIENVEPNYKFHEYEADELMHLQYLRTTSEFPQAYDTMPTKREVRQHLNRSAQVIDTRCLGKNSSFTSALQGSSSTQIRSRSSSGSRLNRNPSLNAEDSNRNNRSVRRKSLGGIADV